MAGHRHLERYFRDPAQDVLAPGCSGVACANLRRALAYLGFTRGAPDFSDSYDASLAQAVFDFQTAHAHASRDGACGPGTRALLARVMATPNHRQVFRRWPDPERRNEGSHAFVSYAHDDAALVRPFIGLMRDLDYRIWFDDNLTAGSLWSETLEQKVRQAWLVIVFLSNRSAQSDWVRREVELAAGSGRRIMPVPIEAVAAGHPLAAALAPHQYLSLEPVSVSGMDEAVLNRLAFALQEAHQRSLDT